MDLKASGVRLSQSVRRKSYRIRNGGILVEAVLPESCQVCHQISTADLDTRSAGSPDLEDMRSHPDSSE